MVASQIGHDPSAVAFDVITSAVAKNLDVAIIDTAGRLHNQSNLQQELEKSCVFVIRQKKARLIAKF